MTNQTQVFSALDIDAHGVANVTTAVNHFVATGITAGYTNFHIHQAVVTFDSAALHNWYTVQVNYYDPAVFG